VYERQTVSKWLEVRKLPSSLWRPTATCVRPSKPVYLHEVFVASVRHPMTGMMPRPITPSIREDRAFFSVPPAADATVHRHLQCHRLHTVWIEDINHDRIHSRVNTDVAKAKCTGTRVSFALGSQRCAPITTKAISVDDIFHVQRRSQAHGPDKSMRHVASAIGKQSYPFPALNKGDVIEGNEGKDHIDFASWNLGIRGYASHYANKQATPAPVHTAVGEIQTSNGFNSTCRKALRCVFGGRGLHVLCG